MENLYLIGNGFDKHHDIPSGYWDFHDWLKAKDENLVEQIDELYDYNGDLWGNFEVELGNFNVEKKALEIYREHPADEMSDHYEQTFHEGAVVAGDTIGEIYNKILEQFPVWVKQLPKANPMKQIKVQDDSYYVTFNYTAEVSAQLKAMVAAYNTGKASGLKTWFEVWIPSASDAFFIVAQPPQKLPMPEFGQNALLTIQIGLAIEEYKGELTAIEPVG